MNPLTPIDSTIAFFEPKTYLVRSAASSLGELRTDKLAMPSNRIFQIFPQLFFDLKIEKHGISHLLPNGRLISFLLHLGYILYLYYCYHHAHNDHLLNLTYNALVLFLLNFITSSFTIVLS